MKITVNNYESFFLDYHEGTLSAEDSAELFLFLEQHSEFKEEFESFENISLVDDTIDLYPDKESLKKISTPTFNNIDEWLIAELEGDLTLQQRTLLLQFLAVNPQYQLHRNLFKKSVVEADMSVVFPDKSQLHKRVIGAPVVSMSRTWYYAAASVIVLLGAWLAFRTISPNRKSETAEKTPVVNPIDTITKKRVESSQEKNIAQTNPSVDSSTQKKDSPVIEEKLAQDVKKEDRNNKSSDNNFAATSPKQKQKKNHNRNSVKEEKDSFSADDNFAATSPAKAQKNTHNRNSVKETLHFTEEKMDLLEPKLTARITEEIPFVFAERRFIPGITIHNSVQENDLANVPQKVISEVKDFAATNINKATGEELLATTENDPKLPFKSRFIRFASSLVGKVTGDKVTVKTSFDPVNGNIAAYEVEMGKNKWQKQF